jgi:hypothetical protein
MVLNAGLVGFTVQLVRVETHSGMSVISTPNHKFFNERNGIDYADALRYNDILEIDSKPRRLLWKMKRLFSTEKSTGFRGDIIAGSGHQRCIRRFGNIIMAQSQKAMSFIILMATRLIMPLTTFSLCTDESMKFTTASVLGGSDQKKMLSNLLKQQRRQASGMGVKRALLSIQPLEKRLGSCGRSSLSNAMFAEKNTPRHTQHDQTFAQTSVNKSNAESTVKTCVKELALFVGKFLKGINTQKGKRVKKIVQMSCKSVPVYDLTVDIDHCYYANGVLVSNSDAFRYFAVGYQRPVARKQLSGVYRR